MGWSSDSSSAKLSSAFTAGVDMSLVALGKVTSGPTLTYTTHNNNNVPTTIITTTTQYFITQILKVLPQVNSFIRLILESLNEK